MRKRFFITIILGLFQTLVWLRAQPSQVIEGFVYHLSDNTPVAYAHVGLRFGGSGVITNEIGAFKLHFPDSGHPDTLIVTHMGFETVSVVLDDRTFEAPINIYLKPDIYQISEIVVRPSPDSARIILKEALARLKANYPTKLYQMNGFYREKTQNLDDYRFTSLLEGMVDIQDRGIQVSPDRMRIRLNQFRKSTDMAQYTLAQRVWKRLFGKGRNRLYEILLQDPVRIQLHNAIENKAYTISGYWLEGIFHFPSASVWVAGITSYDGQKVYQLKFRYPNYEGDIFINSQDYGINRLDLYLTMGVNDLGLDTTNYAVGPQQQHEQVRQSAHLI